MNGAWLIPWRMEPRYLLQQVHQQRAHTSAMAALSAAPEELLGFSLGFPSSGFALEVSARLPGDGGCKR
jgi:hypothetical protein